MAAGWPLKFEPGKKKKVWGSSISIGLNAIRFRFFKMTYINQKFSLIKMGFKIST